ALGPDDEEREDQQQREDEDRLAGDDDDVDDVHQARPISTTGVVSPQEHSAWAETPHWLQGTNTAPSRMLSDTTARSVTEPCSDDTTTCSASLTPDLSASAGWTSTNAPGVSSRMPLVRRIREPSS